MEAVRKRLPKEDIKKLPKENGARDYLSMWDGLSVLDDRPDTIMILNLDWTGTLEWCTEGCATALACPTYGGGQN